MQITGIKKYNFPENSYDEEDLSGNNQKRILVVSTENKLNNIHLALLEKILSAKNINLKEDIILLNLPDEAKVNISRLIREKHIKHLIIFGVQPKHLGINVQWKLYQSIKLGNLNMLVSHNLDDLANNQELKRSLWLQLKNMEF